MLSRVAETISRYHMFEPGQRAGVAVSGGADSVCLLHVMAELAPRWNLTLSVLHLDHCLRGEESRGDAVFVRELAARLGLDVYVQEVEVGRISEESGDNLEQAARRARRHFFLEYLRKGAADRIALGHTRSDQAETVLFRFLRGSGTTGLSAIRPVTAEGFVRPLVEVDRADVIAHLRERGLVWREDSSNSDRTFARNRIRHDLLPTLAREWNPSLIETLAQTAVLAQEDEDYWNQQIDRLARSHMKVKPPAVFLRADWLSRLPKAAARRLVRRAVECAKGDLRSIDFSHIAQILALADTSEGHGRVQAPGLDVFRSFEWIRVAPPAKTERGYRVPAAVPGRVSVPGSNVTILLEVIDGSSLNSGYNRECSSLDWERVPGPLEVRNWRPGDQYRPVGHTSEEKIKGLFQRARVPLWDRRGWPILASQDGAIVWTRQFGAAAAYRATPDSRKILRIKEIEDPAES